MKEQNVFLRDLKKYSYQMEQFEVTEPIGELLERVNNQYSEADWRRWFSFYDEGEICNIKNWLRYRILARIDKIKEELSKKYPDKYPPYRAFVDDCDCDSRVFRMYNMLLDGLLLQKNSEDARRTDGEKKRCFRIRRGIWLETDTMNSFATLFNQFLRNRLVSTAPNWKDTYIRDFSLEGKHLTDEEGYFYRDCYFLLNIDRWHEEWTDVRDLFQEFNQFAQHTHCLANMVLVPSGYNTGRYTDTKDFWDLTLVEFQGKYLNHEWYGSGFGFLGEQIDKFLLDDWFQRKGDTFGQYRVDPLFDGHSFQHKMPADDEYLNCVTEINRRIKARATRLAQALPNFVF